MLVLSRKQGQSILIADQITVTIVELGRGRVRLGISAPNDVPVHREEIALRGETNFQRAERKLPTVASA